MPEQGWGWGWVENGPRPGPGAGLVPSPPYTIPGAELRGAGAWGSREAMLLGSCLFFWGQQSLPPPHPDAAARV